MASFCLCLRFCVHNFHLKETSTQNDIQQKPNKKQIPHGCCKSFNYKKVQLLYIWNQECLWQTEVLFKVLLLLFVGLSWANFSFHPEQIITQKKKKQVGRSHQIIQWFVLFQWFLLNISLVLCYLPYVEDAEIVRDFIIWYYLRHKNWSLNFKRKKKHLHIEITSYDNHSVVHSFI